MSKLHGRLLTRFTPSPPDPMALADDLKFAMRTLRKSPLFSLTAITTIALGIGACTAIFSVVNAVLLRPLPYTASERLAFVTSDLTARNVQDFPFPPGDYPDLRRGVTAFQEVAGVVTGRQAFNTETGDPELVEVANVTTNFFRTLNATVIRGRDFVESDGAPIPPPVGPEGAALAPPPAPPPTTVILSHEFWQRRFGGNPNVVGTSFRIGQQSAEIIGVLAPRFELLWPGGANIATNPDLYAPLRIDFSSASRVNVFMRIVGRLAPTATLAQAQDQVNQVVADLRKQFPVKETAGLRWRVEPMHEYVVAGSRPALVALMGAVTFVLLIACANVANLLLVRASQRERELAVRSALGSRRTALLRQLLVESFAIAGMGGLVGIGLAWAGTRLLIAFGPADLPRLSDVSLDANVLGFALLATIAAAIVFGLVPAIRASRVSVADVLRTAGRAGALAGAGKLLRNAVVVAEVALAFVLLVGSGLMMRSFVTLQRSEPGFDAQGVLSFQIANQGGPEPEQRRAQVQQIRERLSGIPTVTAVSAASPLPLEGVANLVRWGTEAAVADPSLFQQADVRAVQPGYFEAMRTRLVEGRTFTEADNRPELRLAVVDDVFARKAFPGTTAVGRRFLSRTQGPEPLWYEVIGVVQQQRNGSLASESRETIYLTDGEFGWGLADRWIVRTSGDPTQLVQSVRSELRAMDRTLVLADMRPLTELVRNAAAPTRFALICIGIFAIVAAVLASVGLYGVLSTAVRQRTAEIGVRMAFGASASNIFTLVVRQGVALSAIGIVAGVAAAIAATRLMTSMLVGVGATDPLTFIAIALVFLAIATVACWVPARRAASLEPLNALREE